MNFFGIEVNIFDLFLIHLLIKKKTKSNFVYLWCTGGNQKSVGSSRVVIVMHCCGYIKSHELQTRDEPSQGTILLLQLQVYPWCQKACGSRGNAIRWVCRDKMLAISKILSMSWTHKPFLSLNWSKDTCHFKRFSVRTRI